MYFIELTFSGWGRELISLKHKFCFFLSNLSILLESWPLTFISFNRTTWWFNICVYCVMLISVSPPDILHFDHRNSEVRRCAGLPRADWAVPWAARWPLQQVSAFHLFSSFFQALRCQILWLAVIIPHFLIPPSRAACLHSFQPLERAGSQALLTWLPPSPLWQVRGWDLLLQASASLQGFRGAVAFSLPWEFSRGSRTA